MAFLAVSWGGAAGVLLREWIFLHEVVSAGRGVAGPKEWMGLVGAVTDGRAYSPQHLVPSRLLHSFLRHGMITLAKS